MYSWVFAGWRNEATMCSSELQSELGSRGRGPRARGRAEFHDANFCRVLTGTAM